MLSAFTARSSAAVMPFAAGILPWQASGVAALVDHSSPAGNVHDRASRATLLDRIAALLGHVRHVTPIYGHGWVDADGAARDVPEPFRLGCGGPNADEGIVLGDHEFSGATAHLSPRHTPPDGYFNVEIRRAAMLLVCGYAEA